MPFNTEIIHSTAFQKECLAILKFAAEICEIPLVVLSIAENNDVTIIAKTTEDLHFTKENYKLLNEKVILENTIQTESNPCFQIGIPIAFGNETTNGTLSFLDQNSKKPTPNQIKIAINIASQIETLYQLQAQNLELAEKEFYKKILNRLPTEVAVFDQNHKYLYVNPAAIQNDELRNYIIGKDDFEYAKYTERDPLFANERRERFTAAAKTNSIIEWIDEIKKENSSFFFTRKFAPVFNDSDQLEMMVGFGVDITAQKLAEAALKISNERFSYASQATSDALWDWNILTDEIFVGETYSTLFGHQFENNIISATACENFVHPKDREAYLKKYEETLNGNYLK